VDGEADRTLIGSLTTRLQRYAGPQKRVLLKGWDCDTISFGSVEYDCDTCEEDLEAAGFGCLYGCIRCRHLFRPVTQRYSVEVGVSRLTMPMRKMLW
jgi:hypothetical protein